MGKINLPQILSSIEKKPQNKEMFCTTNNLKAQIMCLKAGNSIPPCKMENDVLFYFISGDGLVKVDDDVTSVEAGNCIIVPNEAGSRSIKADTDLEILAVQGLK